MPHPCLSGHQHICPYERYWLTGPGEETRGRCGWTQEPKGQQKGGRRAGGRTRDGSGSNIGKFGEARGEAEATETTATAASGRRINIEAPPAGEKDTGAGGKYHRGGTDTEGSAAKSAKWSGEETEESASEEEAETSGGEGEAGMMLTSTTEALEEGGA